MTSLTSPLAETTALVTGASSGIGAASAVALAEQGANVALVARRKDRLEEVADLVRSVGGTPLVVEADITSADQAAQAVEQAVDRFGQLDVLVNNAGVMLLGPIENAPLDEWDRMVAINLQGLLYITHAALPHLLNAASGPRATADIVNISSVAGRFARRGMGVYNMTKHGVGAFAESLRQEVSERHVRVAVVEPGVVSTELFTHVRPEVLNASSGSFGAGMQMLQAQDIAHAVTYIVTRPARVVINELLVRGDASL
jgi:NADP-dependent 3-hydroxy acid dehydrogenase YdfG